MSKPVKVMVVHWVTVERLRIPGMQIHEGIAGDMLKPGCAQPKDHRIEKPLRSESQATALSPELFFLFRQGEDEEILMCNAIIKARQYHWHSSIAARFLMAMLLL